MGRGDQTTVRSGRRPRAEAEGTPRVWSTVGAETGRIWELAEGEWVVGKDADAPIRLTDSGVSRQHAKIVCSADGMIVIIDLGSTNGTWVNDQRVEVMALHEGFRIGIGPDAELRFGFQGPDAAPARPAPVEHPLTARELQIAQLVAEGLTNRQIAERLSIKTKTVSSHLDNVYARLRVSTRAALTAWVFRSGLARDE